MGGAVASITRFVGPVEPAVRRKAITMAGLIGGSEVLVWYGNRGKEDQVSQDRDACYQARLRCD